MELKRFFPKKDLSELIDFAPGGGFAAYKVIAIQDRGESRWNKQLSLVFSHFRDDEVWIAHYSEPLTECQDHTPFHDDYFAKKDNDLYPCYRAKVTEKLVTTYTNMTQLDVAGEVRTKALSDKDLAAHWFKMYLNLKADTEVKELRRLLNCEE